MTLHDLYPHRDMWWLPYELLREREPHQNISHKSLPSWHEHCSFMEGKPYLSWHWFNAADRYPAGCVYLTRRNEIGIAVLKRYRGQGLAKSAVEELMSRHVGERLLANIAPGNDASLLLFRGLGFGGPIQVTLERPA